MERKEKDACLIDDPDMALDILTDGVPTGIQSDQMEAIQDEIAADLWTSYLEEWAHRRDYGAADNVFDCIVWYSCFSWYTAKVKKYFAKYIELCDTMSIC